MRNFLKNHGVPEEKIQQRLLLWDHDCPSFELALSKRQIFKHDQAIPIPPFVKKADYEFEIGCLLNAATQLNMSDQEAETFYLNSCSLTILNDLSSRDFQEQDSRFGISISRSKAILGKALGPVFVPASSVNIAKAKLSLKINGQERPELNPACRWTFPRLIGKLSHENIILEAGTLLGSGTISGGCIAEHGGKYPWLKPGDTIEMDVEGIGLLRNRFV